MDDIGVNERMVTARRNASLLNATLSTLKIRDMWKSKRYEFGSQSEGSTTPGLKSDLDKMVCLYELNVIQDQSEHRSGSNSLLVIQNKKIFPSYCHLQLIKSDECSDQLLISSGNVDVLKHCVTDSKGRLLLGNTLLTSGIHDMEPVFEDAQLEMHGPALTESSHGRDKDLVYSFYSESLPHQVKSWLRLRRSCAWPSYYVLEDCRKSGCFLVPADSKLSCTPELEWRISTHLQERYVMFSLNITQLRCYVLMKIILKTYINPHANDVLSSYMCKNILLYCISESPYDWNTESLLSKLISCFVRLQKCVEHVNCPHFVIPGNNLMASRISEIQQLRLIEIIGDIVSSITSIIFDIKIDNIGDIFRIKMFGISLNDLCFEPVEIVAQFILLDLFRVLAINQKQVLFTFLNGTKVKNESIISKLLKHKLQLQLTKQCSKSKIGNIYPHTNNRTLQTACRLVIPLVSSTVGSLLAGRDIASNKPVSDEAFSYLTEGKDSDVLSGRLKRVSVMFCIGDMKRTEKELDSTLDYYHNNQPVISVCGCYSVPYGGEYLPKHTNVCEKTIKSRVALCITFLHQELNCLPHELRYETVRSYIEEDKEKGLRNIIDSEWMDFITVDSIPYLHYLQYKTYGRLHRRGEQIQALQCLTDDIVHRPNLGHRETTLNLLGQCCEKENMQAIALKCYISSIKHRQRSNAARLLLCLQLLKLKEQN